MNDIFEQNHPMKDDKEFITSYWIIELTILEPYELKN